MKRNPNLNLYLVCAAIVVVAVYTVGWFYTADQLEENVLELFASLEKKGHAVQYDRLEIKGFPFQMKGQLNNFAVSLDRRSTALLKVDGTMLVSTALWSLPRIHFRAERPSLVWTNLGDLQFLQAKQLEGDITAAQKIDVQAWLEGIEGWGVYIKNAQIMAHTEPDVRETIAFELKDITLNKAQKGVTYPVLDLLAGELTHAGASVFSMSFQKFLQMLYEKDLVVEMPKLHLHFKDVQLLANGTITCDEDLRPIASFSTDIRNVDGVVQILQENHWVSKKMLPMIQTMLGSMGTKDAQGVRTIQKIAVTLQDRELSIGSIPVFRY